MAKHVGRSVGGSRLRTTTDAIGVTTFGRFLTIEPPPTSENDWQVADLDSQTLHRETPERLTELLVDLSPDVNRANWDWMRALNPGWECDVFVPGSTETRHERGYQLVEDFIDTLNRLYGSADVPLNRMFQGEFMRGAIFCELVVGVDKRTLVDLATPDPAIVRFRRVDDPVRGLIFEPGIFDPAKRGDENNGWVSYDLPTIQYIPLDPMPGKPYGRPMVSAALYTALFLLGLLHDLRRVIAQQGLPRPDIEIDLEVLANEIPGDIEEDSDERALWVEGIRSAVETAYANLEPDAAFVHTSVVHMNKPQGTLDTESMGGLGAIIEALERMSVRALKTTPFMMAISESTTETQANRQYEQWLASVRAAQHLAESAIEQILRYALQINGILADPQFRFQQDRKSEVLRDEQGEQLKITNARARLAAGWTSQDEESLTVTGHEADEAEPRDGAWQTALDIAEATQPTESQESDVDGSERPDTATDGEDDGETLNARILAAVRRAVEIVSERGEAGDPWAVLDTARGLLYYSPEQILATVDGSRSNGHSG